MILSILKTKRKKSRKAYLIRQIDAIISKKVRERDLNRCLKCGRQDRVFHHHIFTKTRMTTRWDLRNAVTVCFHCHRWAHSAGEEFRRWVLTWMPQDEYEALYIKSQMRGGYKVNDLEWLLRELRNEKLFEIAEECGL